MKLKGHGSAVAIVVSVLAVVLAGGGTAIAVSSSVNIADPTTPSRIAKVDGGGHLSVAGAVSTINSTGYLYGYADRTYTLALSPTTATVAISRIQLSNPSANGTAVEQQLTLGKYPVTAAGDCDTAQTPVVVARYNLAPGDDVDDVVPAPLVVGPIRGAQYCLAFYAVYLGSSTGTPAYYLNYALAAYVTSGSYTGVGAPGTAPVKPKESAKIGG